MPENRLRRAPTIGVDIPPGYHEIPLSNLEEIADKSRALIEESVPEMMRENVPAVIGTLSFLFAKLAENNALYCGIGAHLSEEDGRAVISWLTISSFDYGEKHNPRLVLSDLVVAKAKNNLVGNLQIVELPGRPVLFFEWTEKHVTPKLPSYPGESDIAKVFQLEVTIPSESGDSIAVIELSTTDTEAGPRYRSMILAMAASVQFPPKHPQTGSLSLAL